MTTKYSVGDKVAYKMPTSIDTGTVLRIEGDKIWALWDTQASINFKEETWFESDDDSAYILEHAVKPEITKELVELVLKAFITTVMSYNSSYITDSVVEKTIAAINRDSDPEYAEYLRLKSKFETN
jgi:hypothetical protein